jgi:hypothetical protein
MASKSNIERRRDNFRQEAREVLQEILGGGTDPYLGYRRLYRLWCANNAALEELRPLFRIEGVEPDGPLSVTAEFRQKVVALAEQVLPTLAI